MNCVNIDMAKKCEKRPELQGFYGGTIFIYGGLTPISKGGRRFFAGLSVYYTRINYHCHERKRTTSPNRL